MGPIAPNGAAHKENNLPFLFSNTELQCSCISPLRIYVKQLTVQIYSVSQKVYSNFNKKFFLHITRIISLNVK
jgi:hypothetical protein